ncbi:MAG: tetratricopeptide repeat protein [Deltaproteobacteria bacterium]|nr:MAG: tetratricopeptide repeat protein [Deltaproteobacteria bacterium]
MKALFSAALVSLAAVAAPVGACGEKPEPVPEVTSEPQSARDQILERAREALQRGVADEAIARVTPLVRERPDDYEARVILAGAEVLAGRAEDGLRDANLALSVNARKPDAWITKSAALSALGELDQAIEAAERAVEKEPKHQGALTNLAVLYGMAKKTAKQKATLEALVALDDDDLASRMALVRLAIAEADMPTAERLCKEIVARNPRYAEAQVVLAAAAYDREDYGDALERARIALTVRGDDEKSHLLLEASFYVTVSAELTCAHGARPWKDEDVAQVLTRVRDRFGLSGVSTFYELDETFGPQENVQKRIARAAKKLCPDAP